MLLFVACLKSCLDAVGNVFEKQSLIRRRHVKLTRSVEIRLLGASAEEAFYARYIERVSPLMEGREVQTTLVL